MEFLFIRSSGHVGHGHEAYRLHVFESEVNPHVLELSSLGNELERVPLSVCFLNGTPFYKVEWPCWYERMTRAGAKTPNADVGPSRISFRNSIVFLVPSSLPLRCPNIP